MVDIKKRLRRDSNFQSVNRNGRIQNVVTFIATFLVGMAIAGATIPGSRPQGPLTVTISARQRKVCRNKTIQVKIALTNSGRTPLLIAPDGIHYQFTVVKKVKSIEHPDEIMTSVSDPTPNSEGDGIVLAPGKSFKKTILVSLKDSFFTDPSRYELQFTYGQFARRRLNGEELFRGAVRSNRLFFDITSCETNR